MVVAMTLSEVTVVALEQAVAAPLATRHLADLGARVIKVERPDGGDFARRYDDVVDGESSYFVWLNRSKESITLDVKAPRGREVLDRLLARADVFVQNLAPGAAARLGLDGATLRARHPGLVVCNITGYDQAGAWGGRKAYDMLVQAEAGFMALTGTPDTPSRAGVSVADIAAGMYAFAGVITALFRRERTGDGTVLDISLFHALAEWMGAPAYYSVHAGRAPERVGARHATIAPYGIHTTADGDDLIVAVQNEREWAAFCGRVLGRPDLTHDPRFATNSARVAHRAELEAVIDARLGVLATDAAERLLTEASIAHARLRPVGELDRHPAFGPDRWRPVTTPGGSFDALVPPLHSLVEGGPRMDPVPAVGEHTTSILTELGYGSEEIVALDAAGATRHAAPAAEKASTDETR